MLKNGWIFDFSNSADEGDKGLSPEAKKNHIYIHFEVLNCIFVGKIVKILRFFVFKALELNLFGVCRQVFIHIMKLHYITVLFYIMVYRRQAANKGRNRRLKKKYNARKTPEIYI